MNGRDVLIVYAKEMRDSLRDRRTIFSMIVLPVVIIPLLMFGMGTFAAKMIRKTASETAPVVILGEENAPELAVLIRQVERFRFVDPPEDLRQAIGNKTIRAAVEIPAGFAEAMAAGTQPTLKVYYHEGEPRSESVARDIERQAAAYRQQLVLARLAPEGLGEKDLEPFATQRENLASQEQVVGRAAGGLLPYIIILMCLTGAMYPAIDLTAGEKERGTMETILASSVSRLDLVLGKFLTVLTASVATALLSLGSLAVTAIVLVPRMVGGNARDMEEIAALVKVNPLGLVGVLALILPLTVLFSALLLTLALFAKSYKEAQSYVSPLMIVVIVPAVIGMLPGTELSPKMALVPIVGTSLASKELLAGAFDWTSLAIIFGSSCLYAVLGLAVAVILFQRESVLFRT